MYNLPLHQPAGLCRSAFFVPRAAPWPEMVPRPRLAALVALAFASSSDCRSPLAIHSPGAKIDDLEWKVFWNVGGGWSDSHPAAAAKGTCPPTDLGKQFNVSLSELGILPENNTNVGENCCLTGCHPWNDGFPYIDPQAWSKGELVPINGGVPQAVNLTQHLDRVREGVVRWIPEPGWSGNAVIDFEACAFLSVDTLAALLGLLSLPQLYATRRGAVVAREHTVCSFGLNLNRLSVRVV